MPALGHINIPADPDKRASLLGLQDKPYVAKQLINFMLDILLLPYGYVLYNIVFSLQRFFSCANVNINC